MRFTLSRDELLTLPEFVLLSLFPNGILPDGQLGPDGQPDAVQVDYDPASLDYMLRFFRDVASKVPEIDSSGPGVEMQAGSAREMLQGRAGIIVLREDMDFYVIPPSKDITSEKMLAIKRAAARSLLRKGGIFSGLRRSEDTGTTEQHLIEMLTAG